LQTGKLLQAAHEFGVGRAAADLHRLIAILDRVVRPAKLRSCISARVVEPCQITLRNARRGHRISRSLKLLEYGGVRLLGIEDGRDVGDRARGRDKSGRQRAELGGIHLLFCGYCDSDVGAPVGRAHRLLHADLDFRRCLSSARFPNGLGIRSVARTHPWAEALGSHARLDKLPSRSFPALLARLLGRQAQCRICGNEQDCPGNEQGCGPKCSCRKRLSGGII
jgi:hypothetical protein